MIRQKSDFFCAEFRGSDPQGSLSFFSSDFSVEPLLLRLRLFSSGVFVGSLATRLRLFFFGVFRRIFCNATAPSAIDEILLITIRIDTHWPMSLMQKILLILFPQKSIYNNLFFFPYSSYSPYFPKQQALAKNFWYLHWIPEKCCIFVVELLYANRNFSEFYYLILSDIR